MDPNVIIFVLIGLLGIAGACSRFIPGWKSDNVVEEIVEEVIEYKTGQNVDLSPDTPEPQKDAEEDLK